MSSSIKDNNYYRQLIVEHYSNPINKGLLQSENSLSFHHFSNSCVDDFFIELTFDQNTIVDAKFDGLGCAISTASIDIFSALIKNKTVDEVVAINENYQAMLQGKNYQASLLSDLVAFQNVLKQPNRIKCALIISESIQAILSMKQENK